MISAISVATYILDIITIAAVLAAMFSFFYKRKSVKLMLIYAVAFVVYVALIMMDEYFGVSVPIARALMTVLLWFMVASMAVVYQSDLKVIFFNLTRSHEKAAPDSTDLSDEELRKAVEEITRACQTMSKSRTGALIVIAPTVVAQHILDTGVELEAIVSASLLVELEAIVSASLLEAIFNTRAPFHDGAAIIKGNKVLAAGCFLPLSQSQTVAKNLGTRHRAGIGITEESDMLTIIVSEETGIISVAKHGELRRFVTPDRLRDILHETLKIAPQTKTRMI